MRGFTIVALALPATLALGGCGQSGTPGKNIEEQNKAAQPGNEQPAASEAGESGPSLDVLFTGDAPVMPVPLQALRFDMPRAEAELAVPDLAAPGSWRQPMDVKNVKIRVGYFQDSDTLRYVQVDMPPTGKDTLTRLWGQPVAAKVNSAKDGWYWQNAAAGIQAVLEETGGGKVQLELWPFVPWKDLLGEDASTLGFEKTPLLGLSEEALMKDYAHLRPRKIKDGRIDLTLPGYEFHAMHVPVVVTMQEGEVAQLYFKLHYGNQPEQKALMEAAFKDKFGEPVKVERIYTTWRDSAPHIQMDHSEPTSQFAFWIKP